MRISDWSSDVCSSDLLAAFEAAVAANPDDHQARFDLAAAQIGAGQRDAAADNLLHIVAADREWNEDAARAKLLSLFEAVGLEGSEEHRGGKECVSTCRSRCWPYNKKQKAYSQQIFI